MGYLHFLPNKKIYKDNILTISTEMEISHKALIEKLQLLGYKRETIVTKTGELGVRGFIIDLFPLGESHPIRLEFFGDTIESIRTFDENTQRSLDHLNKVTIYPCTEFLVDTPLDEDEPRNPLDNYIKVDSIQDYLTDQVIIYKDPSSIKTVYENIVKDVKNYTEEKNIKTYIHTPTKGYPTDINTIVSDLGYGANPYIETTKKIVVVTAPGPCSGKLATCLSQLYHEYKNNVNAGYAKFETFPVWNLPLNHPVNKAYEAATADLKDKNMIDYFHLEKYNITSINYNRDLEVFPVLKNILKKITGKDIYYSPTDMGVNSIGYCITNDEVVKKASKDEIIRRYYNALCDLKKGLVCADTPERIKLLMNELDIDESDRKVVSYALKKKEVSKKHAISLCLPNGKIVTGRETELLSPASSLILNAIKALTNIPDDVYLISPAVLEPILKYKSTTIQNYNYLLDLNEVLIALNICSVTNPIIEKALDNLKKLNNCEAHSTYIIEGNDLNVLKSLRINVTSEPQFYFEDLY